MDHLQTSTFKTSWALHSKPTPWTRLLIWAAMETTRWTRTDSTATCNLMRATMRPQGYLKTASSANRETTAINRQAKKPLPTALETRADLPPTSSDTERDSLPRTQVKICLIHSTTPTWPTAWEWAKPLRETWKSSTSSNLSSRPRISTKIKISSLRTRSPKCKTKACLEASKCLETEWMLTTTTHSTSRQTCHLRFWTTR